MRRIENIILSLAMAVIGFSALAFHLAAFVAPDVVEMPTASGLENRHYARFPEITVESALEGDLQGSLEDYLADHVPARNQAMLFNAAWQRLGIAATASLFGYDTYPTFLGSHYYVVPRDRLIVDRAEAQPADAGGQALDAWVSTLNGAAQRHPGTRFVYDCIARHDQTEANPTYRYYRDRLNPAWVQDNFLDRLDPRIDSFIDAVESYDEIAGEWFATDPHWTLKRALKSYDEVAKRLSLDTYAYENVVTAVDSWQGEYANGGLDLDYPIALEDLPLDFSQLTFHELPEDGGAEKHLGLREDILLGNAEPRENDDSVYYQYFGGGAAVAENTGPNNGRTALFVGDSLSYCLTRFIAANYRETVFLLPGNARYDGSLESYIEQFDPDDVIFMMHATKYESIAEYSPAFVGL